jgi:hypothetical protein
VGGGKVSRVFCLTAICFLVIAGGDGLSAVADTASPGPVSPGIVASVNAGGTKLEPALSGAMPGISAQEAVNDALSKVPWQPSSATGVSLTQVAGPVSGEPMGALIWLVSVQPSAPVGPISGGPSVPAGCRLTRPAANGFVAFIDADSGDLVMAEDGYNPALATSAVAGSTNCADVVICGHTLKGPPVHGQPLLVVTERSRTRRFGWYVGSENLIVRVATGCKRGARVSLRQRGIFRIIRRVPAASGGSIAVALRAVRTGSATLALRRPDGSEQNVTLIAQ